VNRLHEFKEKYYVIIDENVTINVNRNCKILIDDETRKK